MRRYLQLLCVCTALVSAAACDERLSDIAGPTPDLEPTFSAIRRDVLEASDSSGRRACTNCHTNVGRTPAANLNLVGPGSYDQLVNIPAQNKPGAIRVIPGDADNSYLVHKIEGRPTIAGVRMPINGPYMTDGQVLILRRWIDRGAPRD